MYAEFLYVIIDYFTISKSKLFDWLIPVVMGALCFIVDIIDNSILFETIEKSISYIGTLLGFTLAALTLLLSTDKMQEAKNHKIGKKIRGNEASLYDQIVVSYTYLIIIEGFLCVSYFVASVFSFVYIEWGARISNSLFIVLLFHIFFVTVKTITDMYFVLTKKSP